MGNGALFGGKNWTRHHVLTSNKVDDVDEEAYKEVYPVWSIAITKNQRQLAAATSECVIVLWCLVRHVPLIPLRGHVDTIWKVAYSPDDNLLVSSSADGTVRVWEVASGRPVMILPRRHAAWVWSLAWSPDGRYLATAGADAKIILWAIDDAVYASRELQATMVEDLYDPYGGDPERVREFQENAAANCMPLLYWQAHEKSIVELQFAPSDPRQLVSIGKEGTLAVWDAETGALDCRVNGHIGPMTCMAISPLNEELMVTGGEDHTVRIWDMRDIEPGTNLARASREKPTGHNLAHFCLKGHEAGIAVVRFCKDGQLLASGSKDCEVRIWLPDLRNSPTLYAKFLAHEAWIRDLQWTHNQDYIYTASVDGHIFAWSVPSKFHKKVLTKKKKKVEDEYAPN
jgi:WD40 repeat protein